MSRSVLRSPAGVGTYPLGEGVRPEQAPPVRPDWETTPLSSGPLDYEVHHLAQLLVWLRAGQHAALVDRETTEVVAMALYRRQRVVMRQRGWRGG